MAIVVETPRFRVRDLVAFPGYSQSMIAWLEYLVGIGAVYFTVGPLLAALLPDTKWSLGVTSTALLVRGLLGIVSGPLTGFMVQRFGVKPIFLLGGFLTAGFTALVGAVQNPVEFALVFGVALAFADGFLGNIPPVYVVHNWFLTRRSIMMGIANSGAGFGGLIFAPVMALLVAAAGWRGGSVWLAVIILVGTIPAAFFVKGKDQVAKWGVDGVPGRAIPEIGNEDEIGTQQRTLRQITKSPIFWGLFFMFGVESWSLGTYAADQVLYLQKLGITAVESSSALGAAAGVAAASGILLSRISDRVSPYYTLIGAVASMLVGSIIFLFAAHIGLVWVYSIFFGAGYGLFVPTLPVAVSRYFGAHNISRAMGIGAIVSAIFGGLGPFVTGLIVDATGSFTLAIQLITALLILAFIVSLINRPPKYALKSVKEIDPGKVAAETPEKTPAN